MPLHTWLLFSCDFENLQPFRVTCITFYHLVTCVVHTYDMSEATPTPAPAAAKPAETPAPSTKEADLTKYKVCIIIWINNSKNKHHRSRLPQTSWMPLSRSLFPCLSKEPRFSIFVSKEINLWRQGLQAFTINQSRVWKSPKVRLI